MLGPETKVEGDARRRDQDSPPIWIEAPPGWRVSSRRIPAPESLFTPSCSFTPYLAAPSDGPAARARNSNSQFVLPSALQRDCGSM